MQISQAAFIQQCLCTNGQFGNWRGGVTKFDSVSSVHELWSIFATKKSNRGQMFTWQCNPCSPHVNLLKLRKYVFQIARLDISKSNLNYWFFWMESVYERDPNLDMKSMMSNITFSTQVRLLFVAGSRLNTSYDVYTVCSGQQSIICRVGKWRNSSLEIPEDDTASNKFNLKGAQIRISAINVSMMWCAMSFRAKAMWKIFHSSTHPLWEPIQMTSPSQEILFLEKYCINWRRL